MSENILHITDSKGRWPALVLLSGIIFGFISGIYLVFLSPFDLGADYKAYYYAARAFLEGGDFYVATPPDYPDHHFIYQPIVILLAAPFGLFDTWVPGYLIQIGLTTAFAVVFGRLIITYLKQNDVYLSRSIQSLIYGYLLFSVFSLPNILQGQVNIQVGVLVGAGVLYLERRREIVSGVLLALAATLKIFPAAFGVLYLRDQSWRGATVAIGTGLGIILLGIVGFGVDSYLRFTSILFNRFDNQHFVGGLDPGASFVTLRRPISVVAPNMSPSLMALIAALILLPPMLYLYFDVDNTINWLIAAMGTAITVLLVFPSYFLYFPILYFPLIPLLFLFPKPGRRVFLTGAFVANAAFTLRHISTVVSASPLPDSVTSVLAAIYTPILLFGTPVLYGSTLMFIACVVHQYQSDEE